MLFYYKIIYAENIVTMLKNAAPVCVYCCHRKCEWEELEDDIVATANEWLLEEYHFNEDGAPPIVVRKSHLRAYVVIKFGTLGAKDRIVIPECVIKGVYNLHPDCTEDYMGNNKK